MLRSHVLRGITSLLLTLVLFSLVAGHTQTVAPQAGAVELIDLRTENARVFRRPDGSGYAQVFSHPVHYQNATGAWDVIRPNLIPLAGVDAWANVAGPVAVQFRGTSADGERAQASDDAAPLVQLADGRRTISFTLLNAAAVRGEVQGSQITYRDVFPGVDLQYVNAPTSIKENLIFRSPPTEQAFIFQLQTTGITPRLDPQGGITFEPCDTSCWTVLPPFMEDANGATTEAVEVELTKQSDGNYTLVYTPNAAWLGAADRAYPVILDPTVDTRGGGDSLYIQQGFPNTAGYNQRYVSLGLDPEINGKGVTRAFFYAAMPQLPGGSTIDSASLNAYQYYAANSTGYNAIAYRVTTPWQTNPVAYTWNNPPAIDPAAITTATVSRPLGWKVWDLTSLVRQWYSGVPNNGVSLRANPEGSRGSYFCSSAASGSLCGSAAEASQLRPYFVINYTGSGPTPTNTPEPPPPPTATPVPYVPPATPRLAVNPGSVSLNTNATVLLEGVTPGHRVRLVSSRGSADSFGAAVGVADSLGRFSTTLRSGTAGTATLTAHNETVGQSLATSARISFQSTTPAPRPAVITGVRTKYPLDVRYLQGIPVNNTIDVSIDWRGAQPGRATIIVNGRVISMRLIGSTATGTLNMGSDLGNGRNAIRIAIYNTTGQLTDQRDYAPYSVPMPVWMTGMLRSGLLSLPKIEGSDKYEFGFKLPAYKFDILAPSFGVPDGNTKFSWSFAGNAALPLACAGSIDGSLSGDGGFNFLRGELKLKAKGSVSAKPIGFCIWDRPEAEVEFGVEGTRNFYRKPVIVMVAYFNAAIGVFVEQTVAFLRLEAIAAKVLGEFFVDGKLFVGSNVKFALVNESPHFQFRELTVGGKLGIESGYRYELPVAEIKIWVGAEGGVAKRLNIMRWPPSDNWNFDSLTLKGEVGARFRTGWFETARTGSVEWVFPARSGARVVLNSNEPVVFGLIPQPQMASGFAAFAAKPGTMQAFSQSPTLAGNVGALQQIATPLVTNVYTYTEPTLSLNMSSDQALLAWTHNNLSRPVGQSQEIQFSRWNGSTWSTPAPLTNDPYLDGAPQIAWDNAGNAVAVWQRLNSIVPPSATWNEQTAKQLEIVTATYNLATNTWSAPILLTSNDALDMVPRLSRGPTGELIAAWRQNSAGLLSGDATNPDRILVASYGQGTWQVPVVAVDAIPGLADVTIGRGTNTATIAFTRSLMATGASTETLQLFTSTLTSGTWSAPTQLTNDQLGHRSPQISYNTANQPLMIWLAGGELRLRNLATGETHALNVPEVVGGIDELRVVQDPSGNVAAVFSAQTGQRDLYVSFYDEASGLWGQPRPLTNDKNSEAYPAVALDSNGRLLMAYASTSVTMQERTATDPETNQLISYTIPVEGQTDLMTLAKTFERNLTITNAQLALSNERPAAGEVIRLSATISNTGDLPVNGVAVQFFDGDPASGGTALGTVTLARPLAGGNVTTLSIDYTVPQAGGARELYAVVDPAGTVPEQSEADNRAQRRALGPDVEVLSAEVVPWSDTLVGLTTVIRNTGTTTSPPATLRYTRGTIDGTLLVSEPVPGLTVGQVITLTTPLDYGALAAGEYTTVASVNRSDFAETFTDNNTFTTTLAVRPDLLITADDIVLTPTTGATAVFTATVYNNGSIPATNVPIQVFRRGTLEPAAQLFSQVLPSIAPGGSVTVTGTVTGPFGCGLFVAANPEQSLLEMTYTNNLAAVPASGGACADFVYTPGSGLKDTMISFTDTSSGANTAWEWSFGDGTTSTERNPSHVYTKPGIYDVTLRVSGGDGSDAYTRVGAVVILSDPNAMQVYLPLVRR